MYILTSQLITCLYMQIVLFSKKTYISEDKPLEDESNWFYPSVAPAPLELETMSKANNLKINQNTSFCVFVTIVLCVFMIAR